MTTEAFPNGATYSGHFQQEWRGMTSDKFGYNEKKHYESRDEMKTIEGKDHPFLGRKHYDPAYGMPSESKATVKTFPSINNRQSMRAEVTVKTKPEYQHAPRAYGHKEKLHVRQEDSGSMEYRATIKTFYPMEGGQNELGLEKNMGRKKVIDSLEDQRNWIGMKSMGDKAYKYPEYATGFYKERGLVPGSSNTFKESKKPIEKPKVEKTQAKGVKWTDRVKMEEKKEEEDAVKGLFEWEQTSLKEGNPKWRDPDTVEPDAPVKQDPKAGDQKNKKAAGGKK